MIPMRKYERRDEVLTKHKCEQEYFLLGERQRKDSMMMMRMGGGNRRGSAFSLPTLPSMLLGRAMFHPGKTLTSNPLIRYKSSLGYYLLNEKKGREGMKCLVPILSRCVCEGKWFRAMIILPCSPPHGKRL